MNEQQLFGTHIREYADIHSGTIQILEAGCGRQWEMDMSGIDYRLTGVDINADSMRLRIERFGDLHETVVGDLRTVDLKPASFDIVYCAFVLEHVEGAEHVLDRLTAALKPGGLLLLRIPDRDSIWGFLARHTPHRTHVWYKRYVRKSVRAGTPGHGPFPVVYEPVVSVAGMRDYCVRNRILVRQFTTDNAHLRFFGHFAPAANAALHIAARPLRVTADHANLAYVLMMPETIEQPSTVA